MKLNKREKILSIILLVVILLVLFYKFLLSPKWAKINQLKKNTNSNYEKIQNLKNNVVREKEINKDIAILNAKISRNVLELFPSIKEEKIIVILNNMMEKANIECNAITISDIEIMKFKEESEKKDKNKFALKDIVEQYLNIDINSQKKSNPLGNKIEDKTNKNVKKDNSKKIDVEAEKITININFKGSFASVTDFIDNIRAYDKKIKIKDINVTAEEDKLKGNLNLEFYSVPKFSVDNDTEYLKWDLKNEYGKTNPFFDNGISKSTNNTVNNENIEKQNLSNREYDFGVNVVPISSDLPTVIVGKMGDSSKKSYIISDVSGVENIEIYFTKKDGNYYYKYKNSKEYYPGNFSKVGEAFVPGENTINISAISCVRNSTEDVTGVNLNIFNSTDKEVLVDIKYDDNKKPRVSVFKKSGKVIVNRN